MHFHKRFLYLLTLVVFMNLKGYLFPGWHISEVFALLTWGHRFQIQARSNTFLDWTKCTKAQHGQNKFDQSTFVYRILTLSGE